MTIGMLCSAYILLALYLYHRERHFFAKAIRHVRETFPIPEKLLAIPFYTIALSLPYMAFVGKLFYLLEKLGIRERDEKKDEMSEDDKYFIEKNYPEIDQNLEGVSIILNIEDIDAFLDTIIHLFEDGFGEREYFKIHKAIEIITDAEDEKYLFTVKHQGKRVSLVIQIEIDNEDEHSYLFTFYSNDELAAAIDKEIDRFCA